MSHIDLCLLFVMFINAKFGSGKSTLLTFEHLSGVRNCCIISVRLSI